MKLVVLAIAAAVVASSADAKFTPLKSLPLERCLVRGTYNGNSDRYEVKLGWCTAGNTIGLHLQDKYLRTADGYCLRTTVPSAGVPVFLGKCEKAYGALWQKTAGNKWENGYKLCLEATSDGGNVLQKECCAQSKQKFQLQNNVPSPPPKKPSTSCCAWSKKWHCAGDYELVSNPCQAKCPGTGKDCAKYCCVPKKVKKIDNCKAWSAADHKCGAGKKLIQKPSLMKCGSPGYPCSQRCCESVLNTCADWKGKCPAGEGLIPSPAKRFCGNGYGSPACDAACCKTYNPADMKPCAEWASGGKEYGPSLAQKCDDNYDMLPANIDPDVKECNVKAFYKSPDSCMKTCCTPKKY